MKSSDAAHRRLAEPVAAGPSPANKIHERIFKNRFDQLQLGGAVLDDSKIARKLANTAFDRMPNRPKRRYIENQVDTKCFHPIFKSQSLNVAHRFVHALDFPQLFGGSLLYR